MPRPTAALLLVLSFLLPPTAAHAIVITFTAEVDGLIDGQSRLDGSVGLGTLVTGTYIVDPTPSGGPFGEVGAARLTFTVGNYTFDESADPGRIELLDGTGPAIAPVDIWKTQDFLTAQLDPAIPSQANLVGYRANLSLIDNTQSNITGAETVPFIADDLGDWSDWILFFEARIDDLAGGNEIGDLQIAAEIVTWQVTPEPQAALLTAFGLAGIALQRRRLR